MPGTPIAQDAKPVETRADARRKWFRRLWQDLVAARTPLIAIGAYCIILLLPDQTAESIRTMFEESIGWFLLILVGWFFISLYLAMTLMITALLGFARADKLRENQALGPLPALSWLDLTVQRMIIFWIITFAVPTITIIALFSSYAPSFAFSGVPFSIYFFSFFLFFTSLGLCIFVDQAAGDELVLGSAILCLFILFFTHILAIRDLPPLLMITVWIIVILGCLELIEKLSARWGLPLLTISLACFIVFSVSDWNDNHEVRTVTVDPSSPRPQPVGAAFDQWLDARQSEISEYDRAGKPYPVFLFAAEGGGIRAAFLSALVLETLRTNCPDALRHTFLTVGVSGGSVGATLANAAAKREKLRSGCEGSLEPFGPVTAATKAAADDLLRPLLLGMLFADLPSQVTPFARFFPSIAHGTDRARYLETGLSSAFQRYAHGLTYIDLFKARWRPTSLDLDSVRFRSMWDGPSGNVPALMLLATDVSSGRRVAASHLLMQPIPGVEVEPCKLLESADGNRSIAERTRMVALAELLPDRDVAASTAAVLSARFPGVTPAASVNCNDRKLRLVDGGYFENSGLTTALEVSRTILKVAVKKNISLHIVSIENGDASPDWRYAQGLPPANPSAYLSELLSPFRAMEGSRQAHADLARASLEELLKSTSAETCVSRTCLSQIRIRLRRCKTPIPLGWSLSEAASHEIRRQLFAPSAGDSKDCVGMRPDEKLPLESFGEIFSRVKLN